jgi:hypothetical protein
MDERFNRVKGRDIDNAILHLTGSYRPWSPHPWEPRDYFYWETFARSEWRDQTVSAMLGMYEEGEYVHRHVSDCWQHLLRRCKREIGRGVFRPLKYCIALLLEIGRRFSDHFAQ